jgi:Protein of unknown function (DUF565)
MIGAKVCGTDEFLMQNTRISNLLGFLAINVQRIFTNPWRRLAVWLIALLLGNFLGSVVTLVVGQIAQSDIFFSVLMMLLTELVSWLMYRRRSGVGLRGSGREPVGEVEREIESFGNLVIDLLNALKIGFIYSMFVEAFKLGS